MKRFMAVLLMTCMICVGISGLSENGNQPIVIHDADGYYATWEGLSNPELKMRPVDQEGNYLYIDYIDVESVIRYEDDTCRIETTFLLFSEQEPFIKIPVAMTAERYNELREPMKPRDKKMLTVYKLVSHQKIAGRPDADELIAAFPALASEDMYILTSAVSGNNTVNSMTLNLVEETLAQYGYTDEDFEKDLANVAVQPTWIEKPQAKKYMAYWFTNTDCELNSDPGEREIQMATLAGAVSRRVAACYLRPEGEKEPIEDLIPGVYQLGDQSWNITLGPVEEHEDWMTLVIWVEPVY